VKQSALKAEVTQEVVTRFIEALKGTLLDAKCIPIELRLFAHTVHSCTQLTALLQAQSLLSTLY
jgi:hypothetical protein